MLTHGSLLITVQEMLKSKPVKKLTLNPETVLALSPDQLTFVAGGGTFTSNPYSWCQTCKLTCTG